MVFTCRLTDPSGLPQISTPLSVAPISQIQTTLDGIRWLYASTVVLQVDKRTTWLTPVNGVDNGDGSWTFTTASPWFKRQISMTLTGGFNLPFSAIESIFQMDPSSWPVLVAFDQAHAQIVNGLFKHKWTAMVDDWGVAVALNINNQPLINPGLTNAQYQATLAANLTDFPFTWQYNLEAIFYAGGVLAADPTNSDAAAILSTASSAVELVVYIAYNQADQLVILGPEAHKRALQWPTPLVVTGKELAKIHSETELDPYSAWWWNRS